MTITTTTMPIIITTTIPLSTITRAKTLVPEYSRISRRSFLRITITITKKNDNDTNNNDNNKVSDTTTDPEGPSIRDLLKNARNVHQTVPVVSGNQFSNFKFTFAVLVCILVALWQNFVPNAPLLACFSSRRRRRRGAPSSHAGAHQ